MLRRTLSAWPCFIATCALAAPTSPFPLSTSSSSFVTLNDRSTNFRVLADGSSYQSGDITPNLRWQSSGLLSQGCPESIGIQDCYTMSLSASGDLESRNSESRRRRRRRRSSPSARTDDAHVDDDDEDDDDRYYASWETFAAHDDSDLEAYTLPWNAVEATYYWGVADVEEYAATTTTTTRTAHGLARRRFDSTGGRMRDEDEEAEFFFEPAATSAIRKRQDVKKCDSHGGGGSSGSGNGTTVNPRPPSPPTPRQRIELFSWPGARSGETWSFKWKSHQGSTSISSKFFHTWQLLRRDCGGGPVVTLDLKGDKAVVSDDLRGCVDCASVDASVFVSRTIRHELKVTFGIDGSIDYKAFDVTPSFSSSSWSSSSSTSSAGATSTSASSSSSSSDQHEFDPPVLLTYSAFGDLGDQASLKFGQYRVVTPGLRDVTSFVGDYQAKRLS